MLQRAYEYTCIYIFEFAYVAWCLFMPVCLHTHTRLLCVCLLPVLCLCACGRAGMEHGHFATELNSQKRAWSWPAEQYLDSVFMRWTTTAISITAL